MSGRLYRSATGWGYRVDVGVDPATGKRRQRQHGGFATKKQAATALAELVTEVDRVGFADPSTDSLGTYLESWLASVKLSLRPNTFASYEHAVNRWIVPRIGGLKLASVTPPVLQKLYGDLASTGRQDGSGGLGPRSVKLAHTVLRLALEQASAWRLIPTNPATVKLNLPRLPESAPSHWSPEEAIQFLAATAKQRLHPLWSLILATGLRRGEALGLRWEDVDLDAGTMAVASTWVAVRGHPQTSDPKTRAGRRVIELEPRVVRLLRDHRTSQLKERLAAGTAWVDSGRVFTTTLGGPLHPQNVRRAFDSACKNADVPRLTPHGLRHTFATLALGRGVHPKLVQEMLGHADVAITLNVYSHSTKAMHRQAAIEIAELLFPADAAVE